MLKPLCLLLLLIAMAAAHGHGLTMTTAGVTLRNQTHLTIRLEYDPLLLWHRTNATAEQVPAGLAVFANMPDADFEQGYAALQQHLRDSVRIRFDDKALDSPQFHFPSSTEFRRSIRDAFMRIAFKGNDDHHEDHRAHYQSVVIDGFLPQDAADGNLDIDFPPTLGKVLVTFSRPHSQTLSPDEKGVHYRHRLNPRQCKTVCCTADRLGK